jgi:hypothetical protein
MEWQLPKVIPSSEIFNIKQMKIIRPAVPILIFCICLFSLEERAITGWWFNPFTDTGFHTVINTYRYTKDPWTGRTVVHIDATVWHDVNVMSQRMVADTDLTFDSDVDEKNISNVENNFRLQGDSLIKTIKQ